MLGFVWHTERVAGSVPVIDEPSACDAAAATPHAESKGEQRGDLIAAVPAVVRPSVGGKPDLRGIEGRIR